MATKRKKLSEMTITDDYMFGQVMSDPDKAKGLIQRILGNKIGAIKGVTLQRSVKTEYETKGVRFDVFVEADNGKTYDVEMQTTNDKGLAKRTRYYHDMIDLDFLRNGSSYTELKPCFVIFVCTFDPFGKGDYLYSFEMRTDEENSICLKDESYTVFLNINGFHGKINQDLMNTIKYFRGEAPDDEFTKSLDKSVCLIRHDPIKEAEYMTMLFKYEEERQAGREEGREEGRKEGREEERLERARTIVRLCSAYGAGNAEIIERLIEELHWDRDTASAFLKNFEKA